MHGFTRLKRACSCCRSWSPAGFSGPIAGILVGRLGLRMVTVGGMGLALSALRFLSMLDFLRTQWQARCLMVPSGWCGGGCAAGLHLGNHGGGAESRRCRGED